MLKQTPSQTVGPFFSYGLIFGSENILINEHTAGERIYIQGQVFDGDGQPVTDALIEIWQADAQGIHNHPADPQGERADKDFRGFGRSETVDEGKFRFKTIKPGSLPSHSSVLSPQSSLQAPHINVRVFARGMLTHAVTRLYFADEEANQTDSLLNTVASERRPTLIATREESAGLPTYRFDIHLQGERETVFFDP
jgi:protocatechuate 3,4-dioxygenase alpha subunit